MSWTEERRADRAAARDQDRLDAEMKSAQARLDADAAAKRAREAQAAQDKRDREAQAAREKRKERRAAWRGQHAVELLIYPLAVVSAVMAVPAMASYGHDLYDSPTGYALPILSELGMWAFALAVHAARRADADRPVGMLQAGIVVFAAVALGLNVAHGLDDGLSVGLVMGVISVAGVAGHQFAVAAPPRSRAQRAQARIDRTEARRVARARRIAARTAVVDLAADGTARLVFTPGLYVPHRRKLEPAETSGPAVDRWDAALAELTASGLDPDVPGASTPAVDPIVGSELGGSTGLAVLDPPPPVDSTPAPAPIEPAPDRPRTRTSKQVLADARRIARKHGKRVTAEQLRRDLKIAPDLARELRDQVNAELYPKP